MARAKKPRGVQVGERFVIYKGCVPVEAVVIEDRGNLGIGGRQIVRIREPADGPADEVLEYEVPAEDIPSYGVPPAAPPPRPPQRPARRSGVASRR